MPIMKPATGATMAISARNIAKAFLSKTVLLCTISIAFFFSSCTDKENIVPYYNGPSFTPLWTGSKAVKDTLHTIAPFSFTDQYGNIVTNKTFANKIYVADFFFTVCPGICPKMTENMKTVYEHYKNNPDVLFISHSVTPERDSVPVLKKYALDKGITTDQWHFVTGKKNEIYTLARRSYFVEQLMGFSKDSTEFLHTENFILVDKHGHIRGLFNGTLATEPARMIADIDELLKEE